MMCNNIVAPLVVSMPENCSQFYESMAYPAACGAGTATKSCSISISGGQAPYSTVMSYTTVPTATGCTLNHSAFPGGSGITPQFGFGFTTSNACQLSISGNLTVKCVVTDSSGQSVTVTKMYPISIVRYVQPPSGGGGGGGSDNPETVPV